MEESNEITIIYEKAINFKTLLATGVFGGITPDGYVNLNFFIERNSIPEKTTHFVKEGKIEVQNTPQKGFPIREVHTGIVIDIATAKSTMHWLAQQIDRIEKVIESQKQVNE